MAEVKDQAKQYCSMVLVYVDDVLHFDHDPNSLMTALSSTYRLKDKAEAPDRYLGANIDKIQTEDESIM